MQAEPLKYIEGIGVPIDSANNAGVHVSRYMGEMSSEEYLVHIEALTDQKPALASRKHYHITFAYICQNMVRQNDELGAVDPIICLGLALDTVKKHEKIHSFIFLEDDAPAEGSRNVVDGVTRPQGWKREQAIQFMRDNNKAMPREQFIAHCVTMLEMSPAGAASYFYSVYEEVYGEKPPKEQRGKKKEEGKLTRVQQVNVVYQTHIVEQNKQFVLKEFAELLKTELGMTQAGATTYAYMIKKQIT